MLEKRVENVEAAVCAIDSNVKMIGSLVITGFHKIDANFGLIGNEIKQPVRND